MKIHVHIYRTVEKAEFDLEADSEEEALQQALRLVKEGKGKFVLSNSNFVGLGFDAEEKKK